MRRAAAAMSLAATLLAGCASVPHVAPQVAQATPAALGLSTDTATVDAAWWRAFGDPQLDRLIADGLAGNPSLESALARVRIARATLGTEEARREPQVTANGSVLYQRLGTNLLPKPYGGSGKFLPSLQANLDWDLDVFGRQRAAIARAAADARAAELDAASARLTLTTSIAQAYVGLARAERLIVVADSFVAARREALDFVRSRIRNQLASQFDARQAETLLAEAEQARVRAAAERDMLVHALAALTGHGAEAYATIAAPALALDRVPTVPALLPADLLGRRPDLLAGQARIDAAAAGRAVTRADFLPNVDLQALAGLISLGLGSFLGAGSITYSATPAIHLPIFDGGRLRANYAGATAGLDRAVADYDDAVLGAVRDAADAITNVRAADADVAAADRIVAGLRATVRLDAVRTRTGLGSKLDAIDSGFRLLEAEQSLVGSQAAALTRRIELVAALGGGFDPLLDPSNGQAFMTDDSSMPFEREDFAAGNVPAAETIARTDAPPPAQPPRSRTRARAFLVLAIVVLVVLAVFAVRWLTAAPRESTDDAYVSGDVVAVTAREGGTVLALHADNTQAVKAGQPLIELDPAVADVQLAAAEAALGRAVRGARSSVSMVDEAAAEATQARAELARAQADYGRRQSAAGEGAISGEELAHAADAVTTARAALGVAEAKRAEAASTVEGTAIADNPAVLAAAADVRRAMISQGYMRIVAPVGGIVAQRTVQLGQRVAAGTPLMAVVPLDSLWVDANFRETQLQRLRVGQPATITADVYGGGVVFHGHVAGLGAGSGNAFSLLPPQNATGNWIKIVQRVPVRIALDPRELARNPLRIGLSTNVEVDTSNLSGPRVAGSQPPAGARQRSVDGGDEADALIRRIIAANLRGGGR